MLNNIKKNFHELYEIIVVSKTIFYICSALIAIIFFTIRYTGFNFNFLDHESMICKNKFYLYIIILVFFVFYLIYHKEKKLLRIKKSLKMVDNFQKVYGPEITRMLLLYSKSSEIKNSRKEVTKETGEFLKNFTAHICKVFNEYTGKECHVTIKTLSNAGEISSWARETLLLKITERSSVDEELEKFIYNDNTAFEEIIDNKKKFFYTNNWLKTASILGSYKNANNDWKKYYNATLVVPITSHTSPGMIKEKTWGFICVDNKGGGFDEDISVWILMSFSKICFNIFEKVPIYIDEQ